MKGKKILITAGQAKEEIDGVRYFANDLRPQDHGHRAAAALAEKGAEVTLLTCSTPLNPPSGATVISQSGGRSIISAADLYEECEHLCKGEKFDLILHLASVPSLKSAGKSAHKIKAKTMVGNAIKMKVTANIDILSALKAPGRKIAGYDKAQRFRSNGLSSAWKKFFDSLVHEHRLVIGAAKQPSSSLAQDLSGVKIVVTSGPCVERLTEWGDVITNFSSGRQGHETACALADRGATVALVSGPVALPDPVHASVDTVHVRTAAEMLRTCLKEWPFDAYVGVAAVADFGAEKLLSKQVLIEDITLIQNPDILLSFGMHKTKRPKVVVGFAAETENLEGYAREKLKKKGADAIFANLVGQDAQGRSPDRNHVLKITEPEVRDCGEMDKYHVGVLIADFIAARLSRG